jgi:predicted small metal-binding protein
MQELKQISCDPSCGFMVRSHNEKEAMDMAMNHVKNAHKEMKVTKSDMQERMKNVRV